MPRELRQKTLFGYVQSSSSPTRPIASKSPIKKTQTPQSRKRRIKSPSPENDEDGEGNSTGSDVGAIHFEPTVIDLSTDASSGLNKEDEGEEDSSPRRPTTSRLKRKTRASSDDSDVQIVGVSVANKGKDRLSDSSEPGGELVTKKRRLVQGVRPMKDEVEGLMDEVDEDRIIDSRLRKRNKKSAFQKNLEKLKLKKRGQAIAESSPSSSEDDTISDGTNEIDGDFVTPFEGAMPDNGDSSQHDEGTDDDLFIVEDEGAETIELPMEFSMNTHQDLTHHFKIICQLFVHLAVRHARERRAFMTKATSPENKYFYTPLLVARRKLSGLRDQLVASSTWRPGFKRSLEKYPEFELVRMEMALPMCDACHLGGRVSTIIGRVSGLPYDKVTFELLDDSDEDEESDEESDEEESREKATKEFNLGRFCARRTKVFHQFSHWEHLLYTVLSHEVEELRQTDKTGFVKVAFARGIKPPEDHDDADGIMDWLDQRGIIDMEWQRLRKMMDSARSLDAASARGEDDND